MPVTHKGETNEKREDKQEGEEEEGEEEEEEEGRRGEEEEEEEEGRGGGQSASLAKQLHCTDVVVHDAKLCSSGNMGTRSKMFWRCS